MSERGVCVERDEGSAIFFDAARIPQILRVAKNSSFLGFWSELRWGCITQWSDPPNGLP